MGLGDNLMATGMARGAAKRGKRIAFGDGHKVRWDHHSAEIFRGNRNIAIPGTERRPDVEWIPFYKGNRIYNRQGPDDRWIWNLEFRPTPGEIIFSDRERREGRRHGQGFILIEPNVETWKTVAPNKDWGFERYQRVATQLKTAGHRLLQFNFGSKRPVLAGIDVAPTHSFRDALAILSHAKLYIGPEGGLHHGAAAVGIPAVVLFGGFIPPSVTGYPTHTNLTGGAEACGRYRPCEHCRAAMAAISEDEVMAAARLHLERHAA